jgi:hypothetical protein
MNNRIQRRYINRIIASPKWHRLCTSAFDAFAILAAEEQCADANAEYHLFYDNEFLRRSPAWQIAGNRGFGRVVTPSVDESENFVSAGTP